jgi:16S rRNA (uracil1498-N3)-methyltransferase
VHRFFAPDLDPADERVKLPKEEGEHLTRVLRLGIGDVVSVFDGRGREYLGRVVSALRRDVVLQLVEPRTPASEPPVALTLAQAVLKGDRMDDVVRDAVMLGVSSIQPIVTARAETTIAALLRGARPDRWRRVALASAKQSGRALLPEVRTPLTLESFLEEPLPPTTLVLVEPNAAVQARPLSAVLGASAPAEAAIVIGPEGGWAAAECAAAQARGLQLVSLGSRTLRADAVPVAVLSVLLFAWDR